MTFVDSTALSASQLNIHLRDNMIEQAVAKALNADTYFVTEGRNILGVRSQQTSFIFTQESTTTGTYDDLTTPGPAVTATTGVSAIVMMAYTHSGFPVIGWMGYAISGATSRDPSDSDAVRQASGLPTRIAIATLASDLTPGSNTFTAKYKASGGSEVFSNRHLGVWPL